VRNPAVFKFDQVLYDAVHCSTGIRRDRVFLRMVHGTEQYHGELGFDQSDEALVFGIGIENDQRINAFAPS
jgi:hypothetical protein